MVRPKDFSDDVIRKVIRELRAAGRRLNANMIRDAVGGGNMKRIREILNEEERAHAAQSPPNPDVVLPVDLDELADACGIELAALFKSKVGKIFQRSTDIAEIRLTQDIRAAREREAAMQEELDQADDALARADKEVDRLQSKVETLEADGRTLTEGGRRKDIEIATLTARLTAAEERGKAADRAREQAEDREKRLIDEMVELRRLFQGKAKDK